MLAKSLDFLGLDERRESLFLFPALIHLSQVILLANLELFLLLVDFLLLELVFLIILAVVHVYFFEHFLPPINFLLLLGEFVLLLLKSSSLVY